jgi:hypothetical protein
VISRQRAPLQTSFTRLQTSLAGCSAPFARLQSLLCRRPAVVVSGGTRPHRCRCWRGLPPGQLRGLVTGRDDVPCSSRRALGYATLEPITKQPGDEPQRTEFLVSFALYVLIVRECQADWNAILMRYDVFPKAFARTFSVWRYVFGHGQLLLRSLKTY